MLLQHFFSGLAFVLITVINAAAQLPHQFNGSYKGKYAERIAFPIGGMGAGMFCVEGTGSISHLSVRHNPDVFNEPVVFAAISMKGKPEAARVLEGPVPDWKKFGMQDAAKGAAGADWGLPRFKTSSFISRFPFAEIDLADPALPLAVHLTAWSPFIPTDPDHSGLPAGCLEYRFKNTGSVRQEYTFSFNAKNFMTATDNYGRPKGGNSIKAYPGGFILSQAGSADAPQDKGDFAIYTDSPDGVTTDLCWFRGGWYDPLSMAWRQIQEGKLKAVGAVQGEAPGASLFIPFLLRSGEAKTIRIYMAWYVPRSKLRYSGWPTFSGDLGMSGNDLQDYYRPWYSTRFSSVDSLADYWRQHYDVLYNGSRLFRDAFYQSTLPPEVLEAISANLCILKSPTVLRQQDGRFWGWEGCGDSRGSCSGSCTHVWNYAQAVCHLFPSLERGMRETEFTDDQDSTGHQNFRAGLPIRPLAHSFYAAADGQLGGIMKVYRDWRISGDSVWLRSLYPRVRRSLDYCIRTWDPRHTGLLEEPHHNTYDIELWGPDPMCTSIYLGALEAFVEISRYLNEDTAMYSALYHQGRGLMENRLFNGKYFFQDIRWKNLSANDPVEEAQKSFGGAYSPEAVALLEKEGPKYQYGDGVLSDGILGAWMAKVCGLDEPLSDQHISDHILSVYKYNFKKDLSKHSNPQRPTYAWGNEGGLLLCSWPRGANLSLPFVYSSEVWTGIEYQVASHLIFEGHLKEGLDLVRTCRSRYDGRVRNPFDEYECGHWYARALSSYALLQALTGLRYDAVEKILYVDSRIGNFTSFFCTATGFGVVKYQDGKLITQPVYGHFDFRKVSINKTGRRRAAGD